MSAQTKLRLKSRFRVALLLVTMILLLVASPAPPPTCANSFCLWRTRVYFYTDATKTTQCGFSNYSCFGNFTHTGCYSDYYVITECECNQTK
jgi:hypothetical protein